MLKSDDVIVETLESIRKSHAKLRDKNNVLKLVSNRSNDKTVSGSFVHKILN